jgi:hypothetical protein
MKIISNPPLDAAPVEPTFPVFSYANAQVTIAGNPSSVDAALHYASDTQQVSLAASIVGTDNNGPYVAPITLPGIVGLPLVRYANGAPTNEEDYLQTTIVNGAVVSSGVLRSGAWKLVPERVNQALAEIKAPFRLELPVVTFIVMRSFA